MGLSELDLNLGALEIGTLISSILFGVTNVQLYMYSRRKFKDRFHVQGLVVTLWTFEAIHTVILWVYIYRLTVTFYGVPSALKQTSWELNMSGFFEGIISGTVQAFFAYRVLAISGNWIVPVILGQALHCK
ncbi:hypothetical protein BD410DRAFT_135740 [Rickenella mellea]|uniref:Uncharacterized protein n=1 Tax=Rickenella mellea TaxID=50990 RepID=A0A4Y7PL83_9AGAM|nr:hypothetical protein BD410DRAFT_135740 [Rickenella mellea]